MLGLNSGLMGVRRVPDVGGTPGMWTPNEQSLARRAGIWQGGDPHWNNVRLLLQMQGANGSTTFTDSSSDARTATVVGNAQISTARFKWGASSGLFDGNGDRISFTLANNIGNSDFCLEGWFYVTSFASSVSLICVGDPATSTGIVLYATTQQRIAVFSAEAINVVSTTTTIPVNAWCHLAATKATNTVRLFVDGVQAESGAHNSSISNGPVLFGQAIDNGVFGSGLNGNIGAARVTVGQARYTATFTPPTTRFPDS